MLYFRREVHTVAAVGSPVSGGLAVTGEIGDPRNADTPV